MKKIFIYLILKKNNKEGRILSVILAIKDKNKIIMGCDSQATFGNIKNSLNATHNKIFKVKNVKHCLMGVVGSCRDSQLLSVSEIANDLELYRDEYEWVVKNLFHNIYNVLLENNRIDKDDKGDWIKSTQNDYLFAYKNNAYLMSGIDGAVIEINDYLVCGSGSDVAIGVLENNKNKPPEERIREAIKACSDKTLYIDNNIIIEET